MANLIMTNWYIKDKTPYIVIGTAGENNATSISIECDEIIENAEYFLDIGDSKNDIFNTQELTVKQQITPTGETTYILYLKPMRSFLGKEGVKLLQVRCEYIDNDEKVTKESNVFHAVVNKNTGFSYKFDIAIFQQYLNKVKELAAKIAQAISNMTLEELKDTNIVDPTDGQIIKYDAETQKWINGEGGGSGGSSNYNELSNKPKINNVVLSGNKTTSDLGINIPTKTSDLTNDSNFVADANYVHTDNNYTNADKTIVNGVTSALASKANISDLASVATSGDYDDLSNKPSIPQVSVTQTLQSGTKIAEIDVDGTTTNLYAPNGSSTLSELTDVNLSSPTNEQVLTYDSTSNKWVNALAKKEIVHVTELPDGTEIEDKIYELSGGIDTHSDTIEFPDSSQDIRSIEEYFNNRGYFETEDDEDLIWGVTWFPYYEETFVKDNKTYVLEQIFYNFDTQVYGLRYSDDTEQYWMEVQPSTTLTTQVKYTHVEYFIGDSNTHNLVWIKDTSYLEQRIDSLRVENLLNVNITDPLQNNSVLAYDSATNRWKNSSAFATKSEVQAKQDVVQYSELPTPSASLAGKVLQYIGDGTPSKAVVTVIDDGGNKSSTTTGILSYLQNKNIPLNIGVNTYQIGSSNKYYSLAELQALEEQGSEIIMRGGTDSSFSTDAATVEAFTQDAEAVKTYAETNGFNAKLRIYPQGIRVYGGTDVDEKIGVLNDLGVEMAFNLECNVEMYDMSHSHPGYEEWYEYANGHDAGLGIANVAPFVTMPNGYSKGLMLNRAEMTHAKLKDAQRVADINTMIQAHRYVVLFGHSYQSEWTTAGDDGKTTTELFESFIDNLTETYGDEILWLTPTQAWNYFNSLPKTGHFYKCVAENNTYKWQEIPSVSEVTVTPTLSTGTKIGSISVDGDSTDLFAPQETNRGKAVIIGDSYFDKGNDYNFADYLRSKNIYDEVADYAEGGSGFGKTTTGHQTLYEKLQDSQMRADIAEADVIYMHLGGNDILSAMPNFPNAVVEPDIYLRVQESLAEIYAINPDVTVYYIPSMDYKAIQVLFIRATIADEKPAFLPSKISKLNALQALLIYYMIYVGIINSALKIYCLDTPSCYLVEQLASDNMHPTPWAASGMFEAFIRGNYNCTILNLYVALNQTPDTLTVVQGVSATFAQNYNTIFGSLVANRKVSKSLTWIVIPMVLSLASDRIWFIDIPAMMFSDSSYTAIMPYGNDNAIALLNMAIGSTDATLTNTIINLNPLTNSVLPTTDGTYKLQVSHVSGKVAYTWVAG